jgi:hypothetical protein
MRNVYRLLWILSIIGVLVAILITYTEVNDEVYLFFGEGFPAITRSQYFYVSAGLLIFANLVWHFAAAIIPNLPPAFLIIPNRSYWMNTKFRYRKLKEILGNWFLCIGSVSNYWLLVLVLGLRTPNSANPNYQFLPSLYAFVGFGFLALLILPLFRLMVTKLSILFPVEE